MSGPCPPDADLKRLLADQLGAAQEQAIDAHVTGCAACQERLDQLTAFWAALPPLPADPAPPAATAHGRRDTTPRPAGALERLARGGRGTQRRRRLSGALAAVHSAGGFLRRRLWVWPLVAVFSLGAAAWWVSRSIEDALRQQRVDELSTILEADVTALRIWMDHQRVTAEFLAQDEALRPPVQELLALASTAGSERRLLQARAQAGLRSRLRGRLHQGGYIGFVVLAPSGLVVAADSDAPVGTAVAGYRKEFFARVSAGQAAVSRPFLSPLLLADADGELRANLPVMYAAAPVRDGADTPVAVLGLRVRPDDQFTRILQAARSGKSGETYAFDRNGLLLSQSRFDEDLKQMGLLVDQTGSRSILTVELRDPQVNMAEGERPVLRRPEQPLTRMAADAVQGKDGCDADGYRDYRGVPVVGAWQWLEEYDFGVATEIDVAQAFQPAYILRRAFGVLLVLLTLGAAGIFLAVVVLGRQRRALQRATLAARQLGQYTLLEAIGSGGMGTVYKARHAMLRRPTAVKLLDVDRMSDEALVRFEREVQLTSGLTHPNTVVIFDYGRTPEGVFYYAMEYLEGMNLEELVEHYGAVPEARLVYLLSQVCGSLAEAHAAGLVHRDIKPANVFLTCRGGAHDFVKVLDFGLVKPLNNPEAARVTAPSAVAGTPLYLAPEAASRPNEVDARADVYAIGAVGYFLLTGAPVFQGESAVEICLKHVQDAPALPSARSGRPVSPDLESLLLRCLAKAPAERWADAAALLHALTGCTVQGSWTAQDAAQWWAARRVH